MVRSNRIPSPTSQVLSCSQQSQLFFSFIKHRVWEKLWLTPELILSLERATWSLFFDKGIA